MLRRLFSSYRWIFITCVAVTNLVSGVVTAFIWLRLSGYVISMSDRPIAPLLPMVISILLAIPISSAVSARSAKPLRELVRATKAVSRGDYAVRVEESGEGEIRELLHSFNQMTAELAATELMRSDFINTFSHEFKTPIVSIRGFAKRLRNGNVTPRQQEEYLTYIAEESERLSNLASSVLLVSRFENQKLVTGQSEYDLDEQIRDCVLRMERQWEAKHITFELDLPKLPYRSNMEMMDHVWMNLISNAIKFSQDGGRICISAVRCDARVSISVRDEGIGMGPSELGHIFDKFYQADPAHASAGNGLGLSLVQRIVELCGGEISVESQPGQGSVFTVTLPEGGPAGGP